MSQQRAKSKSKEKRRRSRRAGRRSSSKKHKSRSSSRRRSGSRSSSKATKKSRKYPPYPCMDSVQRNLRDLYRAQNRQPVTLVALTNRMKTICGEWRSSQNDAEKLIREFLEECELENMSRQVGPDSWVPRHRSTTTRKRGSKSADRNKKRSRSRRTKRRKKEGAPAAGDIQVPIQAEAAPVYVPQQQVESQSQVQQVAATAEYVPQFEFGFLRRDRSRTYGKPSHHKKRLSRSRCCRKCGEEVSDVDAEGLNTFSSRQLTRLVKDLLAKDEVNFNCKHCLCDKCLGIQTGRNLKCRRGNSRSRCSSSSSAATTPNSCSSSQCDSNMRVISKFLLEHQGAAVQPAPGPIQANDQSSTATASAVVQDGNVSARP
uniref:Uncharacterized protein n=1 Tax=Romanomermis culicivorax TaxID=13658 RepID=A0A915KB93_ROMCU